MTILKYVCRVPHGVGAHHLRGLFVAVSTVTVMVGCTSTTLSTPDQQSAAKCQVTATAPQTAITGIGGSGTVAVNAAPECAWSASTEATWITDISPANGQGAANIQFKAAPNPDPVPRQGDIAVSGVLVHVNQEAAPCRFEVKPQNLSIGFTGGSDSVTVTTAAGCAWSALSQTNWITVTSAKENTGSGTVTIDVAAQPDATARTGSIIVAGQAITVSQGARDCSYSINPSSASFTTTGGTGAVTVAAPVGCTWTATTNAAWITVTTGANGNGSGSVAYSVGANAGAARTGVLLIGAQSFTINQSSAPCSFGIGPTGQNVTRASGTGTPVTVTTQSFCSWTAVSNDPWITVSTANGVGNGNVSWTYSSNPVPNQRTGTMVIAGRTFTVIQEAGCSYVINPTGQNVSRSAGTGTTVGITTQASCGWTATSNASWITVQSPTSGVGNGSVGWTYAENTVAATRTGTMTIADQTFTVTQDPGCSYVISPTSQSVRDAAGTGTTVTVTTQTACGWTAASNASWITVNSGSVNGNGSVGWTYTANTVPGISRTGTMTIAGQTFTVVQAGPCTFSVAPLGQTVSAQAGAGTPLTVTTQSGCFWVAVSNDPWITVTSGASGTDTGTVNISIAANVVFAARAGTLKIAGQIVTVIQNGVAR